MYCHQCGKEVGSDVKYCPYCGAQIDASQTSYTTESGYQPLNQQAPYQQTTYVRENDAPSAGFAVLSGFIPIVGLILFIVWNKEYPQKAKSCLKGLITGIVLYFVFVCCMIAFVSKIAVDSYDDYYDSNYYFNAVVETVPYE